MTRKDYVAIAAAIHNRALAFDVGAHIDGEAAVYMVARDLADVLANDNPRFDRARFLKACGVTA